MSFMFHPYPYDDPNAFNRLSCDGLPLGGIACGNTTIAPTILKGKNSNKPTVIAVDGYPTAPFSTISHLIEQQCSLKGFTVKTVSMDSVLLPGSKIDNTVRERCLPEDTVKDPVLLYGALFDGTYEDLFDPEKLRKLQEEIKSFRSSGKGILLIYGAGSLCKSLRGLCDESVFADVTPMKTMLNLKCGAYKNVGSSSALPFKQMARRCYYLDFELAQHVRGEMFEEGLTWYIIANDPNSLTLLSFPSVGAIFDRATEYPLRCKPVYLEGVWGGYYVQRLRSLPREMKNCAWVFDFIPMEVSIVFDLAGLQLEFPFYTFVQQQAEKLMGKESVEKFGKYFPVRFNYDDTWHSNGNMSIQCHPGEEYVRQENNELGRQDESYYIVEAAQGAKTYLGFCDDCDPDEFIEAVKRSEKDGTPVDYEKYVYAVKSVPGTQVMIPAGTIHASGRNQLILEIGSLTVGSYTYKMYDYLRSDLDGKPRPIHTYHGERVLAKERKGKWVEENLVQHGYIVEKNEEWEELVVGEHDLLYFSLRNLRFINKARQNTNGKFHVLTLVDGEQVMIRSLSDPSRYFIQNYLDIIIVPADFGEYEIINQKKGTTITIHKTVLKE